MQIIHVEEINAGAAAFTEIPDELSENTKSALKTLGITKLYSHQVCMSFYILSLEVV